MRERAGIVLGIGLVAALVLSDVAFGFEFKTDDVYGTVSTTALSRELASSDIFSSIVALCVRYSSALT